MIKARLFGVFLVLAHGAIGDWHLIVAARAVPASAPMSLTLPLAMIALLHIAVAVVAWLGPARPAGLVLLVFFAAVLVFDLYEHFLGPELNNIFRVAPGEWRSEFQTSVLLLLASELLGLWAATRLWLGAETDRRPEVGMLTRP